MPNFLGTARTPNSGYVPSSNVMCDPTYCLARRFILLRATCLTWRTYSSITLRGFIVSALAGASVAVAGASNWYALRVYPHGGCAYVRLCKVRPHDILVLACCATHIQKPYLCPYLTSLYPPQMAYYCPMPKVPLLLVLSHVISILQHFTTTWSIIARTCGSMMVRTDRCHVL